MTCFGMSDQFSYPVQEFKLKNDTQKYDTSCIDSYMEMSPPPPSPPGRIQWQKQNTGKDFGSDELFEEQNKKDSF